METNFLTMDKTTNKILGLYRAEFEIAKQKERLSWIAEASVAIVALLSIFIKLPIIAYSAAILTLVAAIVKWFYSFQSRKHKNVAERARRIILLSTGLGYELSAKEITDLISNFSANSKDGEKWEDEGYYDTATATSYEKFIFQLQESIFYSKHMFLFSAKQTWTWIIVFFFLSIIALFALPTMANQKWVLEIAQVISVVLMFLMSLDLLGRGIEFKEASTVADKIDSRLEGLKTSGVNEQDVIILWGEYNSMVQGAPLIPTSIYMRHRETLEKLYSQRATNN